MARPPRLSLPFSFHHASLGSTMQDRVRVYADWLKVSISD
jgi:hypothetical protein